jgi:hypothetical protein
MPWFSSDIQSVITSQNWSDSLKTSMLSKSRVKSSGLSVSSGSPGA